MSDDNWYALPVLTGARIRLQPLAIEDAPGYLAAAGSPQESAEVFQWLTPPRGTLNRPETLDDARSHILSALGARARGERLAYAQFDVASGAFIGSTSYYEINPTSRALAIGHTWIGRQWWGSGHNVESKLLLLAHAFETLGAVRVVWHTDIKNERSQAAIERLGAQQEGVLRKHRLRRDGTWRDTVQYAMTDDDWPAAAALLRGRLGC
ncbi:MAG TPA: GNAT family protein [Frankiaceae bacterium]|jgi:RimJ/RimL family protein N-acetyltransferase|nr:GNAT family protein [Frankiaceae bacterium]